MGVSATLLALSSVLTSVNVANAATFNFSFDNENGAVNGTVSGSITLPDGDGTFPATSVVVTSAPASLGYTLPVDGAGFPVILANTFTVIGGMIDTAVSQFSAINTAPFQGLTLNSSSFGGSFLTLVGSSNANSGVRDTDNSTVSFSAVSATTPEPTSVITLIGVGVLGVASKLKKKA